MKNEPWGFGKVLNIIDHNFLAFRCIFFVLCCFLAKIGLKSSLMLYLILELFIVFCKYRGPQIDIEKRELFKKWFDESLVASGGETSNILNVFMEYSWERWFPNSYSDWWSNIFRNFVDWYMAWIMKKLNVNHFFFGKQPPRIIQVITESGSDSSSMSLELATIMANDFEISMSFSLFWIPITIVLKDISMYLSLKIIIETPNEASFLYLAPMSSIVFSSVKAPSVISSSLIINGYNIGNVPFINNCWNRLLEYLIGLVITNEWCAVWDWVTGAFSIRHMSRQCTDISHKLFENIATPEGDLTLGRFSMPEDMLYRFNETRKILWDRALQIKLKPNQRNVQMSPAHGDIIQPYIYFDTENKPYSDIFTQTDS